MGILNTSVHTLSNTLSNTLTSTRTSRETHKKQTNHGKANEHAKVVFTLHKKHASALSSTSSYNKHEPNEQQPNKQQRKYKY